MDRELKRKAVISVAVHALLIIFLMLRSFISCQRVAARNISPFIDLQLGAGGSPPKGRPAAEAAASPDDAFPAPAKKSAVAVSKRIVKRPEKASPLRKLSESEIKRLLGAGLADRVAAVPGEGTGAGGQYHPYALYLSQIRAIMYEAWQQPSSLIGKKGLVTTVEIRVQRDGTLAGKKIIKPAGNAQMDDSVLRALETVTRLPELPPGFGGLYKDLTVDFELTEMVLPTGD